MSTSEEDAEWRNPVNWRGGPLGIYCSRRDPRAFVPKRSGLGATINFARPLGIAFLVAILGFAALMFWLTRGTSR
jgi:uncharacterized membrane protein